jgi:Fe-S cluster assembly scaffold protein SufB
MAELLTVKRLCEDMDKVDMHFSTFSADQVQTIDICIVQTKGTCDARIVIEPLPYTKSQITINIFAENTAQVNCVCNLVVPKEVEGVETDIQMRSWPFDRSKISARPEMFIANSNIKAAHGNALGTLKPSERYYLKSKGIDNYKDLIKNSLIEHAQS